MNRNHENTRKVSYFSVYASILLLTSILFPGAASAASNLSSLKIETSSAACKYTFTAYGVPNGSYHVDVWVYSKTNGNGGYNVIGLTEVTSDGKLSASYDGATSFIFGRTQMIGAQVHVYPDESSVPSDFDKYFYFNFRPGATTYSNTFGFVVVNTCR